MIPLRHRVRSKGQREAIIHKIKIMAHYVKAHDEVIVYFDAVQEYKCTIFRSLGYTANLCRKKSILSARTKDS